MSSTSPPPEAQRYGRSQTPESPRPVHIPEPSNIPVLLNQMDPVFNNTATYNIPEDQTFSPLPDPSAEQPFQKPAMDEHDAVQSFLREAENQAAPEPVVTNIQDNASDSHPQNQTVSFPSVSAIKNDDKPQVEALPDQSVPQESPQVDNAHNAADHGQEMVTQGTDVQMNGTGKQTENQHEQPLAQIPKSTEHAQLVSEGVDYQSLLDNITQSASKSPTANVEMASTTSELPIGHAALPSVPGLPPKPPPQENPVDFPSYVYPGNAQQQQPQSLAEQSGSMTAEALSTPMQHSAASFQEQSTSHDATQTSQEQPASWNDFALPPQPQTGLAPGQPSTEAQRNIDPAERPWSPRTQGRYDQFLEEERRYVTEGIWDKFPIGSRLFVGNLPSEKVTKRDLFHKFHRHGKLAQISIKQAYGFVQFLESSSCLNALSSEQGVEIRGRKVHLEISKPQKNTRGAGSKTNQPQARRRSRSPERNNRRNYSDFREDSGRRSNDYRNRRSPSPRGYRPRDDYRPSSRNGRPRSPIYPPTYGGGGSQAVYDDEANLPLPRRDPRSAPDVQVLVLEPEIDQSFINWVEQGFRMKGLQASTMWLNPRLPLVAVIKRQIIEGVQAVVKLTRVAQSSGKIPLQVFDRSAGASNVNFNEYVDLDLSVAADIVLQARMRERSPSQPLRPPVYPPQSGYPYAGQYSQQPPPPPNQYPGPATQHYPSPAPPQYPYTTQANTYGSASNTGNQPPDLQQLLANLRQPSNQPGGGPAPPNSHSANGVGGGLPGHNQYSQNPNVPQNFGQFGAQPSPHSQPNVQNIMEQLARYQR